MMLVGLAALGFVGSRGGLSVVRLEAKPLMFASGPFATDIAVQGNIGCWGKNGSPVR
jgi:hypothetical protein